MVNIGDVIRGLLESEIPFCVEQVCVGAIDVGIGDEDSEKSQVEYFDNTDVAAEWLHRKALELFPDSEYAKQ